MSEKTRQRAIGEALIEAGIIDEATLRATLTQTENQPIRLCSRLYVTGAAGEEPLLDVLSLHLGFPGIVLSKSQLDLMLLGAIPRQVAERQLLLIAGQQENRLLVAMADPHDGKTVNELAFLTGKEISPYLALQGALQEVVIAAYEAKQNNAKYWTGHEFNPALANPDGLYLVGRREEAVNLDVTFEDEGKTAERKPGSAPMQIASEDLAQMEAVEEEAPAANASPIIKEKKDEPEQPKTGATVLIVDDEKEILVLLSKVVSRLGCTPVTADRGLFALKAIKQCRPSLIILDAMLPEVHGFEICKKVKTSKKFGHVPVIMISAVYTGWRFAADIQRVIGADYFLEKPFKLAEIEKVVQQALNRVQAAEAKRDIERSAGDIWRQALSLYQGQNFQAVINMLEEALLEHPFSARLHYLLGAAFDSAGQEYRALNAYEDAVRLDPALYPATKNLANLYQRLGFRHKALEAWERALTAAPNDALKKKIREHLMKLL